MPKPKEIEFYVDEEQFLSFARAMKKGFRASELGWVEMEVKDVKMTLSTAKAGSVLACIGRGNPFVTAHRMMSRPAIEEWLGRLRLPTARPRAA